MIWQGSSSVRFSHDDPLARASKHRGSVPHQSKFWRHFMSRGKAAVVALHGWLPGRGRHRRVLA